MREILVVEDNEDIRLTTIEFLEMEGFSAFGCTNGQDALTYLRADNSVLPKLMLVDLSMPVLDGTGFRFEQMADLKLKGIPFVVMSADGRIDAKCKMLGIEKCIKKPLDLDELIAVVKAHLA